jgi:hypothetical protein
MDLHIPAPPPSSSASESGDGVYGLAETSPPAPPEATAPADAPANGSAAAPPVLVSVPVDQAAEDAEEKARQAEALAKQKAEKEAARARARKRRRRAKSRFAIPAWAVSLAVHVVVLGSLATFTLTSEGRKMIANINSALVPSKGGEPEMTPIYADPANQRSDEAVGNEHAETAGGASGGGFGGIGTGPPSATPAIGKVARVGDGSGGTGLGSLKIAANVSGLSLTPAAPGLDLGGGGMIAGDVTYEASDVGASLDQIAREILRHLSQHKVTVVWLFDESGSMKDDQKAIREKFDRVSTELKLNVDNSKKSAGALNHAIVGFGQDIHYEIEKPTTEIDSIGRAIDKLRVDDSGTENTLHALADVIAHYSSLIKKDRRLLIVLVTDESGDDGGYVEEAHQAAVSKGVPLYVIGRQSLFGYERAHLKYVDPVTKDVYWPAIHRGPETADVELLQWDGLHDRWDEQPSGFAPYELARMAKDTGGIYFLLPSEENMRVRQREKAYRIADLKEYVPDYTSRIAYVAARNKSEFRRTLYDIIQLTRTFPYRRHFPIDPGPMTLLANEAGAESVGKLNTLLEIQKRLESLQKLRDREPEKRWQAHYDLMLGQIVAYQIKSYEYRACLEEMVKKPPRPRVMPTPELTVEWVIDHSQDRKAPKEKTEKKYAEATRLLKEVISRHPKTPWADLAQDEINRGFGAMRNEWHHNPRYDERAKLVPKY